ncbi:cytochrome c oxidase assembly protein [Altererythrobacter aquiaggeris]|uniref:cytochrome c oxidase assembly protein n=1 Tax=Aestuarierythrobacter aquiaggeris TaxID=1898396 RepID=UPI00301618E7
MSSLAGPSLTDRNLRTGMIALLGALAMLGLGFAAVPLYDMFCRVTGFGGTTQRVTQAEAATVAVTDKVISIRFDANVGRDMPWSFRPEQSTDNVSIGGRDMAIYIARNDSNETITGTASFNVEPEQTGKYFNKIQCFCFTEQTLQPGQEMRMPVLYYIDPAIKNDENARDVEQITLSYTFHRTDAPAS